MRNSSSSRVPLPSVSILAISSLAIFEATAPASPSIWKTRRPIICFFFLECWKVRYDQKKKDLAVKYAFNDPDCLIVVNLSTVVRIKPTHISLLLIREKFHPHFKGPTEFFFWRPGADKVVDHDELKEVHVPIAVSVKSSECSNLKHLVKSDFPTQPKKARFKLFFKGLTDNCFSHASLNFIC